MVCSESPTGFKGVAVWLYQDNIDITHQSQMCVLKQTKQRHLQVNLLIYFIYCGQQNKQALSHNQLASDILFNIRVLELELCPPLLFYHVN